MTGAVRSLVSSRLVTRCGGEGSTSKPTLSQEPAKLGEAKLQQESHSRFLEIFFSSRLTNQLTN